MKKKTPSIGLFLGLCWMIFSTESTEAAFAPAKATMDTDARPQTTLKKLAGAKQGR